MDDRPFIPETQTVYSKVRICNLALNCCKQENHSEHKAIHELTLDHLPEKWRKEHVLHDLEMVARRVVQLKVVKTSPSRPGNNSFQLFGSGFITFDPVHGAVVNTSKHVVWDPFEAEHTIVTLFYDDDKYTQEIFQIEKEMRSQVCATQKSASDNNSSVTLSAPKKQTEARRGVFMYWGSREYFRSVWCIDYSAFSCKEIPVNTLFSKQEIESSNAAFSWWNFSLKYLNLSPQQDIDVAVISHPHGGQKIVTFGKMNRLYGNRSQFSLYTATTCEGSSGAPVIRLCADSKHYFNAGQFVHHGYCKINKDMGMGTFRPPITFPYWKIFDTKGILLYGIGILYEPVIYWTMVSCDFLHIESTFHNMGDVFAYTSTFSALLLTMDSLWFRILVTGFWLQKICGTILTGHRLGLRYALCYTVSLLISSSMFMVAWCLLLILPRSTFNIVLTVMVWIVVLFLERYYKWSARFRKKTIGPYTEQLKYRMAVNQNRK